MTILKADPDARKKTLFLLLLLSLIGAAIIQFGKPHFEAYLRTLPAKDAIQLLYKVLSICCCLPVFFGIYFCHYGWKIIRCEQWPTPGTKVIRDTVIRKGLAARRRGLILVSAGVLIIVMALFMLVRTRHLISSINKDIAINKKSNRGLQSLPQATRPR